MGEGNSESLVTAGGCSTAQIEARNHPLNFLKPLPLGCRRPCLVQPTLPSLTGPGSQRSAVQGAGFPEAGRWVMAGPLGNPRPLSTQPGTSATAPQPSPATRTGHHLHSSPGCRPQHITRHTLREAGTRREKIPKTDSQDACSPGPEFLGIEFQTHTCTRFAPKCFHLLLATGKSREGKGPSKIL